MACIETHHISTLYILKYKKQPQNSIHIKHPQKHDPPTLVPASEYGIPTVHHVIRKRRVSLTHILLTTIDHDMLMAHWSIEVKVQAWTRHSRPLV